jgi:hypothetical protein
MKDEIEKKIKKLKKNSIQLVLTRLSITWDMKLG